MERRTDSSYYNVCDVCDKVLRAEWINDSDKLYFHFTKGGALYNQGRELLSIGSNDAFNLLVEAMDNHLVVFDKKGQLDRDYYPRSEEYCINTMHNLIQAARRFGADGELFKYLERLFGHRIGPSLDPLVIPLSDFVRSMPERGPKTELDSVLFYLSKLDGLTIKGRHRFKNVTGADRLKSAILAKRQLMSEGAKGAK
jgi:hypothetical protein